MQDVKSSTGVVVPLGKKFGAEGKISRSPMFSDGMTTGDSTLSVVQASWRELMLKKSAPFQSDPTSASDADAAIYVQTNLVSDIPGLAEATDPHLVNPWGVSFRAGSPLLDLGPALQFDHSLRGDRQHRGQ
jgi:hypothetical protein